MIEGKNLQKFPKKFVGFANIHFFTYVVKIKCGVKSQNFIVSDYSLSLNLILERKLFL